MKQTRQIISLMILCILYVEYLQGQQTVAATGGTTAGSGGSVTYTVGQVAYNYYSGINGSVIQGVQKPWEISTVTAVENTGDISLVINVYPNPTIGSLKLIVKLFDNKNLRFRLYDMNGSLLMDSKIEGEETEILLNNYSSALYFLKVINGNQEVRVFKIVKN